MRSDVQEAYVKERLWSGEQSDVTEAGSECRKVVGDIAGSTEWWGVLFSPGPENKDLGWMTFKFAFNPKIIRAHASIGVFDGH